MSDVRLAADIGGTFTDVVLEHDGQTTTTKVLTTSAPEDGVLVGVRQVLERAAVDPRRIGLFVHGTTLATNALIERKGAVTALLTTGGFRDSVEMAHENRFEQYDIFMDRPEPLVPRHRRFDIPERMAATGEVLLDLHEDAIRAVANADRIPWPLNGLAIPAASPTTRNVGPILGRIEPPSGVRQRCGSTRRSSGSNCQRAATVGQNESSSLTMLTPSTSR